MVNKWKDKSFNENAKFFVSKPEELKIHGIRVYYYTIKSEETSEIVYGFEDGIGFLLKISSSAVRTLLKGGKTLTTSGYVIEQKRIEDNENLIQRPKKNSKEKPNKKNETIDSLTKIVEELKTNQNRIINILENLVEHLNKENLDKETNSNNFSKLPNSKKFN